MGELVGKEWQISVLLTLSFSQRSAVTELRSEAEVTSVLGSRSY